MKDNDNRKYSQMKESNSNNIIASTQNHEAQLNKDVALDSAGCDGAGDCGFSMKKRNVKRSRNTKRLKALISEKEY